MKLIVNAKNIKGGRSQDLYILSQETVDFVNRMATKVRGQKLEIVTKVVKANHATKVATGENGVVYKYYDDNSAMVKE